MRLQKQKIDNNNELTKRNEFGHRVLKRKRLSIRKNCQDDSFFLCFENSIQFYIFCAYAHVLILPSIEFNMSQVKQKSYGRRYVYVKVKVKIRAKRMFVLISLFSIVLSGILLLSNIIF